jgi:uncharacterized protein
MNIVRLMPFNFKKITGKYLIVNIAGDFAFLPKKDFDDLVNLKSPSPVLENRFYFKSEDSLKNIICAYQKNKDYLKASTSLFILVVTNRCNLSCIYCQASRINSDDKKYDMDFSTAKQTADFILQFPSKHLTIEFQGGEPLLNFDVIKFVVKYVKERKGDKEIDFSIVSNLVAIDEEIINFIVENNISLCTSCDGDKEIQDYNRPLLKGSCFDVLEEKLQMIKKNTEQRKFGVNGILTTTKKTLNKPKEIIDEYLRLGLNSIYIRPVNPFGLAKNTFAKIGYSPEEFIIFYKECLRYILEVNREGITFVEGAALIFLKKILGRQGVNHMEYRSPCGAAIGQIAINYDGNIYTCDEGRMMAQAGDDSFKIGKLKTSSYKTLFDNEITKTMCTASCMEGFPRCNQCPYLPYCGICPIINHASEGDIFKNNAFRCRVNEGIIDYLFNLINENQEAVKIFNKWISNYQTY